MNTPRHTVSSTAELAERKARLQRWLNAFTPVRELGRYLDAPAFVDAHRADFNHAQAPAAPMPRPSLPLLSLTRFLAAARALLATDDEATRGRLERRLLKWARPLHAAGLFELVQIRHVGMQRMIDDHLAQPPHAARIGQAR